jgi:hypothetical protein
MQKLKATRSSYSHIRQIRFKQNSVRRGKEDWYILIKGTIQQEDITILNMYVPNISAHMFIKQTF